MAVSNRTEFKELTLEQGETNDERCNLSGCNTHTHTHTVNFNKQVKNIDLKKIGILCVFVV